VAAARERGKEAQAGLFDVVRLATPLDMRTGTETARIRVMEIFGVTRPNDAYLPRN
jgi:hypothetical protein